MLDMLRDLMAHKGYANSALLRTIQQNSRAAADVDILSLLHHVLVANRFRLLSCLGQAFVLEEESRGPESLDDLVIHYHGPTNRRRCGLRMSLREILIVN